MSTPHENPNTQPMPAPWPISIVRPKLPWSVVNPNDEKVGPYTGRCQACGSNDLWDDCTAYGCNNCGALYSQ